MIKVAGFTANKGNENGNGNEMFQDWLYESGSRHDQKIVVITQSSLQSTRRCNRALTALRLASNFRMV